jgi:hypothetical protein
VKSRLKYTTLHCVTSWKPVIVRRYYNSTLSKGEENKCTGGKRTGSRKYCTQGRLDLCLCLKTDYCV